MGGCVSQYPYGTDYSDKPRSEILYHGSPIDIMDPQIEIYDNVLLSEKVLFVSEQKWLALCFLNKSWSRDEIVIGRVNDKAIILELVPKSFKKYYSNRLGFLYELSNNGEYHGHYGLGLAGIEWISNQPQSIVNKYQVFDIWKALKLESKNGKVTIIKYSKNSVDYQSYKKILCKQTLKDVGSDIEVSEDLSSIRNSKN